MALEELKHLRFEVREGIAWVTIDRPEVRNAISLGTMGEIERVLDAVEGDPAVRALVLTGAGDRAFVSGGDLKDFARLATREAAAAMSRRMQGLMARLAGLAIPVVAAINGDAMGGGCEVALACDLRMASCTARMGFKQVTIGITPAWGGLPRLVRLVGRSRALWLLLTGETVAAAEAQRLGLIDFVVEPAQLGETAHRLARGIASHPALALRTIKRMVDEGARLDGERAAEFEAALFAETWISEAHWRTLAQKK